LIAKMAKHEQTDLGFAFFGPLRDFYLENRRHVRSLYKDLSKKFLDFNDPKENNAFLREPQFEALEMYIFLKSFATTRPFIAFSVIGSRKKICLNAARRFQAKEFRLRYLIP